MRGTGWIAGIRRRERSHRLISDDPTDRLNRQCGSNRTNWRNVSTVVTDVPVVPVTRLFSGVSGDRIGKLDENSASRRGTGLS